MSATRTPRKAGTKPARVTAPTAVTESATDVADIAQRDGENVVQWVQRLAETPDQTHVMQMMRVTLAADDAASLRTFSDRVMTSTLAGLTLAAAATLANAGVKPKKFAEAAKLVGVTDQNGETWLRRAFSTLRECWQISTHHSEDRMADFVQAWHETHGVNPESVRAYAQWCTAAEAGGATAAKNTAVTLKARKVAAEKVAAAAKAAAETKRTTTKKLADVIESATDKKSKPIAGCPLTVAQWETFSETTLHEIELLAGKLRMDKAEAAREAARKKKLADAAAETGPTGQAAARTTVVA